MVVFSYYGLETLLKNALGLERDNSWYIKLFTNQIQPHPNMKSDYFVQPVFKGYDKIRLTDWQVDEKVSKASAAEVTWKPKIDGKLDVAIPIYGYFVTNNYNKLLWSERIDQGPFNIVNSANWINITPAFNIS